MRTIVRIGALALMLALLAGVCAAASVEITGASLSGKTLSVTTTVDVPTGAQTILAVYDENGKMIAVDFAETLSETMSVKPSAVKAFAVDAQFAPLCAAASADVAEPTVVTVLTPEEFVAANDDTDCDVIAVAASFTVTQNMVIEKDVQILDGVTLTVQATVQCNGTVTVIGSGKLEDAGGFFAVQFGIEEIGELDDNWG